MVAFEPGSAVKEPDRPVVESSLWELPQRLIVDLIHLVEHLLECLVPTVASLFHRRRNKPSKVPMESLYQELHGDVLISSIGYSEPNRL